jgi:hypothetical protein
MTSQSQLTHTLLSKREITHRLEIKISKVWYDEMIISCFCSCLCSRSKGGADSFPRFLIEDTTLICHSLIGVLSSTELCCGIFLVSFAPMRRMGSTMYFDAWKTAIRSMCDTTLIDVWEIVHSNYLLWVHMCHNRPMDDKQSTYTHRARKAGCIHTPLWQIGLRIKFILVGWLGDWSPATSL